MSIFSRFREKLFGRKDKQELEQAEYRRVQAKRDAEQARAIAARAKREAADAARVARELSSPQTRAEKARQAAVTVEHQRRREQEAKAEVDRLRRNADEAERRARLKQEAVEQALRNTEALKAKARESLLRIRKNMSDADFAAAFRGPRPEQREYDNEKTGAGDLPGKQEFLNLGIPYSAFASSNVEIIQYDPRTTDLYVCYLKGHRWYQCKQIGKDLAGYLYQAASKGISIWDELRVRGTLRGNKFVTARVAGPPSDLPLAEPDSTAGMVGVHGGF